MLALPADRACNVIQSRILRDAVVTKEEYDGNKKARAVIDGLLEGKSMVSSSTVTYGTWEDLPIADEEPTMADPTRRRVLGPLPPETIPTDNPSNPFPGLEPPMG